VRESRNPENPSAGTVLSVIDLRKEYGHNVAVEGISFHVGTNEIVGLLGPNGAGKTTIINMILGVLEPTFGTIHIEGVDIANDHLRRNDAGKNLGVGRVFGFAIRFPGMPVFHPHL
jgi:ABC-2 type transport system ATP-binding protein